MNDGIILLNKKAGVTSFRALNPLKRVLGKKTKLGHTGTLDQFAEGLMVVLSGSLTRLNSQFSNFDKEYEAVISFGAETDTLDPTGQVVKRAPLPSLNDVNLALKEFLGLQQQIPPAYSAIHLDGKRASDRVRDGENVVMQSRSVTFYHLAIIDYKLENNLLSQLRLSICCSKGTYIRSFARDLAYRLGSCGHLTGLIRTGIGYYQSGSPWLFSLEHAIDSNAFDAERHLLKPSMLEGVIPSFGINYAKDEFIPLIERGSIFKEDWLTYPVNNMHSFVLEADGSFIALVNKSGDTISYQFVRSNQ